MQQHLKLKRLLALVADLQHRAQAGRAQRDAVNEPEGVWPGVARLIVELRGPEAKVELHARALRRGLTQVLPRADTREAMLLEFRSRVVLGRGPEVLLAGK